MSLITLRELKVDIVSKIPQAILEEFKLDLLLADNINDIIEIIKKDYVKNNMAPITLNELMVYLSDKELTIELKKDDIKIDIKELDNITSMFEAHLDTVLVYNADIGKFVIIYKDYERVFTAAEFSMFIKSFFNNIIKKNIYLTSGYAPILLTIKHINKNNVSTMKEVYKPGAKIIIKSNDIDNDKYNSFRYTKYTSMKSNNDTIEMPKYFGLLIDNLTNNNDTDKKQLLNWIASYYQTYEKSTSTYLIKGVQGSGKNLLFNYLKSLYGVNNTYLAADAKSFLNNFNSAFKNKTLVCFEESDMSKIQDSTEKMKSIVTSTTINIELKGRDVIANYNFPTNILFFTNKIIPFRLETGDRRFNVINCKTSLKKLKWFNELGIKSWDSIIEKESKQLSQYFLNYNIDLIAYNTPIMNIAKETLTESSLEVEERIASAVKKNDLDWFNNYADVLDEPGVNGYSLLDNINRFWFTEENLVKNKYRINARDIKNVVKAIKEDTPDVDLLNTFLGENKMRKVNSKNVRCYEIDAVKPIVKTIVIEGVQKITNDDFDFSGIL